MHSKTTEPEVFPRTGLPATVESFRTLGNYVVADAVFEDGHVRDSEQRTRQQEIVGSEFDADFVRRIPAAIEMDRSVPIVLDSLGGTIGEKVFRVP